MQQNIDTIKTQIKENINMLISNGKIEEAKSLISEYKETVSQDIDIYSMDAVISIIEENFHKGELIIKQGINIDPNFGDLYYNLAYISKLNDNYKDYLRYLSISYNRSKTIDNKSLIKNEIIQEYNISESDFWIRVCPLRVLIVCHFYSVFCVELIENLYKNYNIEFEILTMDNRYLELHSNRIVKKVHIYNNIQQFKRCLEGSQKFNIINIHFVTPFYSSVVKELKKVTHNLVCSFWGSDFYRITNKERKEQEIILNEANRITFCNKEMGEEFSNFNNNKYKENIRFVRFGLAPLNEIKYFKDRKIDVNEIKDRLKIPKNKIVVACGYSSTPAQNHIEIIENLVKLDNDLLNKMFFVFPMTYGDENYTNQLKIILSNTNLNFKVFDQYMSNEEVAQLRIISEIMIHVPISDQLSGSMQETLYCGGIVITGSWLPYRILREKGVKYFEVNKIEEVNEKIAYIISNVNNLINENQSNSSKIWELSSWNKNTEKWFDAYNELIERG